MSKEEADEIIERLKKYTEEITSILNTFTISTIVISTIGEIFSGKKKISPIVEMTKKV